LKSLAFKARDCSNQLTVKLKDIDRLHQSLAGCHHVMIAGIYEKALREEMMLNPRTPDRSLGTRRCADNGSHMSSASAMNTAAKTLMNAFISFLLPAAVFMTADHRLSLTFK
jgi:hypothetical protein